jgi:hypothetical protein
MTRHSRFKSSQQVSPVVKRKPHDLTGNTFVERVRAFTSKYSTRVHLTLAPVFKFLVVHPNGTTRRYRSAIEARSSECWSRREMEAFVSGLVPNGWREEDCPVITTVSQTWDEKTLPTGSYPRQLYREYVLRNRGNLALNDASGWERLFSDARSTAWAAARRHPNT